MHRHAEANLKNNKKKLQIEYLTLQNTAKSSRVSSISGDVSGHSQFIHRFKAVSTKEILDVLKIENEEMNLKSMKTSPSNIFKAEQKRRPYAT